MDKKEFEYLNSLKPKYKKPSPTELLETFPEAIPMIKRNYRLLKHKKERMEGICAKHFSKAVKIFYNSFESLPKEIENEMYQIIYKAFHWRLDGVNRRVTDLHNFLKIIEWKRKPKNTEGISDWDITHAKQIPLSNFIELNRAKFALCPFHNEKTPSFKYYPDRNRFYCFGCNENGDVIDYVMKIFNLNFISAVKRLLNK